MGRGCFISFEGIEGCGKTTVAKKIFAMLSTTLDCILTREPGGSDKAERIRQLVLSSDMQGITSQTECLLMYAARMQHLHDTIRPALASEKIVICDRFLDASYAYQHGGRGVSLSLLRGLDEAIVADTFPDMTIFLDAPVDVCLRRIQNRDDNNRFDQESVAFYTAVRDTYLTRLSDFPDRIIGVDATLPLDEVVSIVLNHISKRLYKNG